MKSGIIGRFTGIFFTRRRDAGAVVETPAPLPEVASETPERSGREKIRRDGVRMRKKDRTAFFQERKCGLYEVKDGEDLFIFRLYAHRHDGKTRVLRVRPEGVSRNGIWEFQVERYPSPTRVWAPLSVAVGRKEFDIGKIPMEKRHYAEEYLEPLLRCLRSLGDT